MLTFIPTKRNNMKSVGVFYSCLFITILFHSCSTNNLSEQKNKNSIRDSANFGNAKQQINNLLDSFNIAAANADHNAYFNYFNEDAIFIGTDATENWDKKSFMIWTKPYFDKGKAWNFKSLERNIYFDKTGNVAWFDELLSTQMKICRGSGVLTKKDNDWKIEQYVLSATMPNSKIDDAIKLKTGEEDSLIDVLIKHTNK